MYLCFQSLKTHPKLLDCSKLVKGNGRFNQIKVNDPLICTIGKNTTLFQNYSGNSVSKAGFAEKQEVSEMKSFSQKHWKSFY